MSSSGNFHQDHLRDSDPHLVGYDETHPWPATLPHFWPRALEDRFAGSQSSGELNAWAPDSPRFWPRALGAHSQSMELLIPGPRREPSEHANDFHPDTYASDAFEAQYVAGSSSFDREWAARHGMFSMQSVELPLENPPSPNTSSWQASQSDDPGSSTDAKPDSLGALYRHYVSAEGFAHPKSHLRSGEWPQSVEVPFPSPGDDAGQPASSLSGSPPPDAERSSKGSADIETVAPDDLAQSSRTDSDSPSGEADDVMPSSPSCPRTDDAATPSTALPPKKPRSVKGTTWHRLFLQKDNIVRSKDTKTEVANPSPRTPVLFTTHWYGEDFPGIALVDAEAGRVQALRGFDQLVPLVGSVEDRMVMGRSVTLVIEWPGYPPWISIMPATNHFSSRKDGPDSEGPFPALTVGEIAQNVAQLTRNFIQQMEYKEMKERSLEDPLHAQSPTTRLIVFEEWALSALEWTQSSWQPQFRPLQSMRGSRNHYMRWLA